MGDVIETSGALVQLHMCLVLVPQVTLYMKDVNGTFPTSGSLFFDNGDFVGEFVKSLHSDDADYSHNGVVIG